MGNFKHAFKYDWNLDAPGDKAQAEVQKKVDAVCSRLRELEDEKDSLEEELRELTFERYYNQVALELLAKEYMNEGKNLKKDFPLNDVNVSGKKISVGDVLEFVPFSEISWVNSDVAFREQAHAFGRVLALNDKSALMDILLEPRMRDWKMTDYGFGNFVIEFAFSKIYDVLKPSD